jgi:hypothetical protein
MTMAKHIAVIIIGAIIILCIGILLSIPIHNWTSGYFPINGPDDETKFLKCVIFVEWPIFLIIGGISGNWVFKRYLTNKSSRRKKPRR